MSLGRNTVKIVTKLGVLSAVALSFIQSANADEFNFVSLQYPPIVYKEKAEVKGIATDLVREVFKRMGHTIKIKVQPWARSLADVKNGDADAIFTAYKNDERVKFLDYSNEIVVPQKISIFVSKASGLTKDKLGYSGDPSVFSKYAIGARLKVSYGTTLDGMLKDKKFKRIDMTNKPDLNLKKLVKGRIDIMPMNRYNAWDLAKNVGVADQIVEIQPAVQNVPSFIAFSKKRKLASVRDQFDAKFREVVKDGTFQKIMDKYLK